jgi:hypothetical protein
MPTKATAAAPWQELEKQAYHAFREWHIWLALRERELSERGAVGRADKRTPGATPTAARPERTKQEELTS